jgi:hypothetical protein
MTCDVGQGLKADTQRPPAGMPGGIFEDTLRSAVLHLLLSLFSPCRARRPRRVANGCDRPVSPASTSSMGIHPRWGNFGLLGVQRLQARGQKSPRRSVRPDLTLWTGSRAGTDLVVKPMFPNISVAVTKRRARRRVLGFKDRSLNCEYRPRRWRFNQAYGVYSVVP